MKYLFNLIILSLIWLSHGAYAVDEKDLLSADQAFKLTLNRSDDHTLHAHWQIADGYYLYKKRLKAKFLAGSEFTVAKLIFPAGIIIEDKEFGDVEVFRNELSITIPILAADKQPAATETINNIFTLKYQGCADVGVCYSPIKVKHDLATLELIAPSSQNIDPPESLPSELSEQDAIAQSLAGNNILLILLSFFGFGLLLAFTPCVFPMIPILSSIIIGQGKEISTKRAFSLSLAYVIAMALSYTLVGILAALFGTNLQIWFQTPWVLISFSLVFVILSLSMFGFYELQMPASVQLKLNAISNRQQSGKLLSAAIMGVLSALIVGPCVTAPLIGALIYIGQTGDAVLGGAALFSLGLGMGAPLLVIGTSAGKLLPRSGIWMEKVKYAFGVSMLAVAIWLVSRVINPLFTQLLWAILLIASAIYMGALISHNEQTKPWQLFWKALGFSVLIWGILLVIGVGLGQSNLLSPLQPLLGQAGTISTEKKQHKGIIFEQIKGNSGFNQRLAKAAENDQILMLDLYADWCISCKEMEVITFVDDSVVAAAKSLIPVQIDLTDNNEEDQALLKRFSLIGPPAILFFNSRGHELKNQRLVGYTDPVTLLDHIKQVTATHQLTYSK